MSTGLGALMQDEELKQLADQFDAFVPVYAGYMKSCIASVHLSLTQLNALRAIGVDEPVTMAAIAQALRVTPYAVTKIVDALEKDLLVERRPHPSDRRALHVVLTAVGQECLAAGLTERKGALGHMLGDLDAQEREALGVILTKMTDRIAKD